MYRIVRIYKEKEKPMWDLAINGVDFYHIGFTYTVFLAGFGKPATCLCERAN